MVSSRAVSVEQYLAELPPERRAVLSAIRDVINQNLPPGYVESMSWGMIGWGIPLSRYGGTYNGQPLSYLALAAQKNNYALYSMCAYMSPAIETWLREVFRKAGLKLDMGKSCIRFKSLGDLPQAAIAGLASGMTVEQYIERYEALRSGVTMVKSAAARAPAKRSETPGKKPASKPAKPQAKKLTKPAPAKREAARKVAKPPARPKAKPAARRPAKKAKRR